MVNKLQVCAMGFYLQIRHTMCVNPEKWITFADEKPNGPGQGGFGGAGDPRDPHRASGFRPKVSTNRQKR